MKKTSAMSVVMWDIDKVIPYERNAKKHPPEQVEKVARLIEKHGWTQPIVVDGAGVIIAGHGRRLAAKFLGLKQVPVVVRADLSPEEADGLRLADNRVSSDLYDTQMIQDELTRLAGLDLDLSDLGFDDAELDFLTADLGAMDDGAFVDDIAEAVEDKKVENEAAAEAIGDSTARIGAAFGFLTVSVDQARRIKQFMGLLSDQTGKKDAEALMAFFDEFGVPA